MKLGNFQYICPSFNGCSIKCHDLAVNSLAVLLISLRVMGAWHIFFLEIKNHQQITQQSEAMQESASNTRVSSLLSLKPGERSFESLGSSSGQIYVVAQFW